MMHTVCLTFFKSVFLFEFLKIIQFFDDIIHQRNWRIFKM